MPRYKKLKPQVELRATGRIIVRDNRKTHYRFFQPRGQDSPRRFELRGKSSKYLVNTVIPYYRTKVHNEQKMVRMYKEKLIRLQGECNKVIKGIRRYERAALNKLIRKNNSEFRERIENEAIKIANKRINTAKIKASMSMHGAFAFPVLMEYARRNDISNKELAILIILHLHDSMSAFDFIKFGYTSYNDNSMILRRLCEEGFAERFEIAAVGKGRTSFLYMASVKGHRVVMNFNMFYTQHIKKIIESDEYKQKALKWREI